MHETNGLAIGDIRKVQETRYQLNPLKSYFFSTSILLPLAMKTP